MSSPRITYTPRSDATPEAELPTLANVYKFVLDCQRNKEAATSPVSRPDDAERSLNAGARSIIQDTK